jgi:hypothetical protein
MVDASALDSDVESCIPHHFNEFGAEGDASSGVCQVKHGLEIVTQWHSRTRGMHQCIVNERLDVAGHNDARGD